MNSTQAVIVYRNRAEADFWEGGYFVPLIAGLGTFMLTMVILFWIAEKFSRWPGPSKPVVTAITLVSIFVGVFTFKRLFI